MIYTSSYKYGITNRYTTYSISKDKGKDALYNGECYLALAPKESFFRIWRNNTGKIDQLDNNKYYINEFYHQILEELDPQDIYNQLDNSILLCYEDNNEFCHRHLVAAWLELFLDIKVPEVKILNDEIIIVDRPQYIKDYLEKVIKESKDMKNFSSLSELYLFEKSNTKKKVIK